MSIASKRSFVALEARRIAQTPAAFSNWPGLLSGVARSRLGGGPETLTFRTRGGQSIAIPNAGGARVPVYEVFAEDCYDLAWFLGDLADRPIQVLDIGAHVGTFSCWLGRVHPEATIDAYEPAYDTAQFLRRNVEANALSDRVTVHEAALAGETGWAMFDRSGAASGFNHLASVDADSDGVTCVDTVTFDDVVGRTADPIELVKMDCEGGEYDLVFASDPVNWQHVQRLVLEYHPVHGHSWEDLRAWFADVGLHVVRSSPGTPGLGVAWLSREPLDDPIGRAPGGKLQQAGHDVRRVVQTPTTFRNWPELLGGMVRERAGNGPDTLTFRTRSGLRLTCPNVAGARLPAYEQFAEDTYRLEWFLGPLLERPIHAVDAGAHVGTFACRLAELHPTATITCLEPSAETARYLERNIEQNSFGDRIAVEEAALTGETGWAEFDDQGDASVHSGLVRDGGSTVGSITKVRSLAWESIVASSPAPIDFVKLDCEGGEYELPGSSPDSWRSVQRVVLEYHDVPGASWADLRAWFATMGLHVVFQESTRRNLGLAWLSRATVDFPSR